jgi:hypothetical protein
MHGSSARSSGPTPVDQDHELERSARAEEPGGAPAPLQARSHVTGRSAGARREPARLRAIPDRGGASEPRGLSQEETNMSEPLDFDLGEVTLPSARDRRHARPYLARPLPRHSPALGRARRTSGYRAPSLTGSDSADRLRAGGRRRHGRDVGAPRRAPTRAAVAPGAKRSRCHCGAGDCVGRGAVAALNAADTPGRAG